MMGSLVLGGMPTDIDVERLRQELGVPRPGDTVPYKKIEDVLHLPRTANRWKSVVGAWRRRLYRENNVMMKAMPNEGYRVLDNHGRVDHGMRTYKGGLRRVYGASVEAVRIERAGLDASEVRTLDHIASVGAQLRLTAITAARQLRYPDPEVKRLAASQG